MSELPTSSEMSGEPPDTIEIELTPEDLSPLRATQQQSSGSDAVVTIRSNAQRPIARITRPLTIMFAFVALRSVAQYGGLVAIPTPDAVRPVAPPPPPPQLVYEKPEPPVSPMRMANPFDPSEVFEFPAGTSKAEARESIANVLMQRARDRRPQLGAARHRARQAIPGGTTAS